MNKDQCRCRDCGRWVSYYDITKTFDGLLNCINCDSKRVYYSSKSVWHGDWLMCRDCEWGWSE